MYNIPIYHSCNLQGIKQLEGETIEQKLVRVMNNEEAIKDGAPIIFTERKKGVLPECNVRTDRFEIACDAMDKVAGARIAKRESPVKMDVVKDDVGGSSNLSEGKAEPSQ